MNLKSKTLIVGQGIAGSTLAHVFAGENIDFEIIDNGHETSSSHAAVGLWNPIVIKRLVKSWKVDTVLPAAYKFYAQVERLIDQKIFFPNQNYRKIATQEEVQNWQLKSTEEDYEKYIHDIVDAHTVSDIIDAPYGYGKIDQTGRLDIPTYLSRSRILFSAKIREEVFDYAELRYDENSVQYKDQAYARIIFCEGYKINQNPFFENIKMKPVKGETLLLKIPDLKLNKTIKSKVFIVPEGEDLYRVGSTYKWDDLNENASEKAKEELLQKLGHIVDLPYEIIEQKAGVRPAAHDRRPILGPSLSSPNILCFNGLGAKGVMLAPYFASVLFEYLFKDGLISKVVSTERYK